MAVVMVLLLAVVAPVAYLTAGGPGVLAAACAMLLCFAGGVPALLLDTLMSAPELVRRRTILTMLPRFVLPLGCCVAICIVNETMADAGLGIYIVIFFLVMLAVETGLTLAGVAAGDSKRA